MKKEKQKTTKDNNIKMYFPMAWLQKEYKGFVYEWTYFYDCHNKNQLIYHGKSFSKDAEVFKDKILLGNSNLRGFERMGDAYKFCIHEISEWEFCCPSEADQTVKTYVIECIFNPQGELLEYEYIYWGHVDIDKETGNKTYFTVAYAEE